MQDDVTTEGKLGEGYRDMKPPCIEWEGISYESIIFQKENLSAAKTVCYIYILTVSQSTFIKLIVLPGTALHAGATDIK